MLGLWLPLKVEDKEDDGHCCSSCENQNQGFRGRMRKSQRKKEFEEEIRGRRNSKKKKSKEEHDSDSSFGFQRVRGRMGNKGLIYFIFIYFFLN